MDRPEHHLVLLLDWVVAARQVEDAARGCLPAAYMLLLCAHALASQSRDPAPLTAICLCYLGEQAAFDMSQYQARQFERHFAFPY